MQSDTLPNAGHRAAGAILLDLPAAIKCLDTRKGQGFWMRPRNPQPQDPRALFARVAQHRHTDAVTLVADVEVTRQELEHRGARVGLVCPARSSRSAVVAERRNKFTECRARRDPLPGSRLRIRRPAPR